MQQDSTLKKNTIYVQSDIPEISEMYLLMNMHVGIGELMRTASFKDKARKALGINSDSDEIEKRDYRQPDQPACKCRLSHLPNPDGG